jgi:hypothetical protein
VRRYLSPVWTLLFSIAVGDECLNSLLGALDCVHRCAKNDPLGRRQFAMEADFVHGAAQPQHQIVDVVGVGQKKTAQPNVCEPYCVSPARRPLISTVKNQRVAASLTSGFLTRKAVKRWALVRVVEPDLKQLSSLVGGGLPFPLEYGHLSGLRQQRMASLNRDILYSAIGGY